MNMEHTLELFEGGTGCDNHRLIHQAAKRWSPPFYLLDGSQARKNIREIRSRMQGLANIAYTLKANPWLARSLTKEADYLTVCSEGELDLCRYAGVPADKIILDGVLRTDRFLSRAMSYGVSRYCVDSVEQMRQMAAIPAKGQKISVLLRVSSGNRFGLSQAEVLMCLDILKQNSNLDFTGIQYYSGTQRKGAIQAERELNVLKRWLDLFEALPGGHFNEIQFGIGVGIPYFQGEPTLPYQEAFERYEQFVLEFGARYTLTLEIGRMIAASSGTYVTQVFGKKRREGRPILFCLGGTNHIQYPGGVLGIRTPKVETICANPSDETEPFSVYGSLCSEDDVLAQNCFLDSQIAPGDLLVFQCAGAYAPVLSQVMFLMMEMPYILVYNEEDTEETIRCVRRNGLADDVFYRRV